MRAGLLKEVIEVFSPVVNTNDFGEQTTIYNHSHTYRARILHRTHGRENMNGDVVYPNSHELQVRIYTDINDYDIILFQNHYYRLSTAPIVDKESQSKTLTIEQIEGNVNINENDEN